MRRMYWVGNSRRIINRSRGFTLLELMVVLVIASLLVMLAPPVITGMLPGIEVKGAARQVVAALRYSRNHAITRGEDALLLMDLKEKNYRVTGRERSYQLPEQVKIEMVTVASEQLEDDLAGIRFFPDGSSTGGRISLLYKKDKYEVDVDWFTGRVQIHD